MKKWHAPISFLALAVLSTPSIFAAECSFPLDQKIFYRDMQHGSQDKTEIVKFEQVAGRSNLFRVEGVYARGSDGNYRFTSEVLAEWPTRSGSDLGRITEVTLDEQCRIEFRSPVNGERYRARYQAVAAGLKIQWFEDESLLRFAPSSLAKRIVK